MAERLILSILLALAYILPFQKKEKGRMILFFIAVVFTGIVMCFISLNTIIQEILIFILLSCVLFLLYGNRDLFSVLFLLALFHIIHIYAVMVQKILFGISNPTFLLEVIVRVLAVLIFPFVENLENRYEAEDARTVVGFLSLILILDLLVLNNGSAAASVLSVLMTAAACYLCQRFILLNGRLKSMEMSQMSLALSLKSVKSLEERMAEEERKRHDLLHELQDESLAEQLDAGKFTDYSRNLYLNAAVNDLAERYPSTVFQTDTLFTRSCVEEGDLSAALTCLAELILKKERKLVYLTVSRQGSTMFLSAGTASDESYTLQQFLSGSIYGEMIQVIMKKYEGMIDVKNTEGKLTVTCALNGKGGLS